MSTRYRCTKRTVAFAAALVREMVLERSSSSELGEALLWMHDLRGLPLKLLQLLHELPEVVPQRLRGRLAAAYEHAPPVHPATIVQVLQSEFGRMPSALFDDFDPAAPIAVASIGQVHRANYGGRPVVVKVQFPGLAEDVRADLRMTRLAIRWSPGSRFTEGLIEELTARFLEEIDYRNEANALRDFARGLSGMPVSIPTPISERSTRSVLTMSVVPGESIQRWLRHHPPQSSRRQVSSAMLQIWAAMVFRLRRIHADPSLGNVLVDRTNNVGLVDFGSTRRLSAGVSRLLASLLREPAAATSEATRTLFVELGLLDHNDEATFVEVVQPLARWFAGPRADASEPFRFSKTGFAQRGRTQLAKLVTGTSRMGLHPEFVLLFRALHGVYALLEHLGVDLPPDTLTSVLEPV